jgi:hypothetical protein
MWHAEAKVNGRWVVRAISANGNVASETLTVDRLRGRETRLSYVSSSPAPALIPSPNRKQCRLYR